MRVTNLANKVLLFPLKIDQKDFGLNKIQHLEQAIKKASQNLLQKLQFLLSFFSFHYHKQSRVAQTGLRQNI